MGEKKHFVVYLIVMLIKGLVQRFPVLVYWLNYKREPVRAPTFLVDFLVLQEENSISRLISFVEHCLCKCLHSYYLPTGTGRIDMSAWELRNGWISNYGILFMSASLF